LGNTGGTPAATHAQGVCGVAPGCQGPQKAGQYREGCDKGLAEHDEDVKLAQDAVIRGEIPQKQNVLMPNQVDRVKPADFNVIHAAVLKLAPTAVKAAPLQGRMRCVEIKSRSPCLVVGECVRFFLGHGFAQPLHLLLNP